MSSPKLSLSAVALACASLLLSACATAPTAAPSASSPHPAAIGQSALLRQDAIEGAYEVAVHPASGSIFVAATPSFEPDRPGYVHRLDARTLQAQQTIQLPRRAFALGLNRSTGTLYVGNTLDGSLTAVDTASGFVKGVFQLAEAEQGKDGKTSFAHTRKVLVDEKHDRLFVTSPGRTGKVWIVDGASGQVRHTIETGEPWTAGAAYDEAANRLYVSQGGIDEILAIDPDTGAIVQRFSTGDSKDREKPEHFFINLAIDAKGGRLFATDANSNQVYVFDIASGSFVRQVPVGGLGALDIAYNPQRNEFYTTHRGVSRERPEGTGALTVFDAATYTVKRVIDLPPHPNSLALAPDGATLYVTVKVPHGEKHPAFRKGALDSVVRVDL